MSGLEIPLLRESSAFAARLRQAAARFGDSRYRFHRRINWMHRYDDAFYSSEAASFRLDAPAYLAGRAAGPTPPDDVFAHRVGAKQVASVLLKVAANRAFDLLGRWCDRRIVTDGLRTYRKGYVDDIELVYDRAEADVLRAIHPFPISAVRQWRYLRSLCRQGLRFKLAGTPYLAADLLRFLWRRNLQSLMRMESRAQILQAQRVLALGMRTIQLSDEFDIGSLDFARRLARAPAQVVNSAHGVGKYLPVHAYAEFHVLTLKQQEYYSASRPCAYRIRSLNDQACPPAASAAGSAQTIELVLLSQVFAGISDVVATNEARLVQRLAHAFSGSDRVALRYKPHPNRHDPQVPRGFSRLVDLSSVNGRPTTVFASFFSTCQVDPAFKGRKVLVRGELIHPEISFDDTEVIVTADGLIGMVNDMIGQPTDAAHWPRRAADAVAQCAARTLAS